MNDQPAIYESVSAAIIAVHGFVSGWMSAFFFGSNTGPNFTVNTRTPLTALPLPSC